MKKKYMILFIIIIYCLILKYMLHVIFPFLLAILFYFVMKPFIDYFDQRIHMQRHSIGIILLVVFYFMILFVLAIIVTYGFFFIMQFIKNWPEYYVNIIEPFFNEIMGYFHQADWLKNKDVLAYLQTLLQNSIFYTMTFLSQIMSRIPTFFFSFLLFIISSFFLVIDYESIKKKFYQIFPYHTLEFIIFIKNKCLKSLGIYLKCQLILMVICFFILWIGFSVLRFQNALLYALLTAFLDSLPFIGVGIVILPMCLFYLFKGIYLKALYLFLLYLIINVVRSLLEPQIMNKQLQIPSFLLLLSMMIHLYFFGLIGIILSPIHMNIIYSILDAKDKASH
ncbi:AI-2E family transporter [Longibaculum muris]|uniref:AI-2E family transporter n=1 Tax=Longibaculum muris TaxID=1796628 RepID=UPI0022E71E12|nr:AI-2E family transporter [Longibaculum muris]